MTGTHFAYRFEARSIQGFVLDGGRLRDMVGASELVESLCTTLLDDVIAALDLADAVHFPRRAGGAFMALSEDRASLERLRDLWTLIVPRYAPGLDWVHALAEGETAMQAAGLAGARLLAERNRLPAELPQAGPLAARTPRTGTAAVAVDRAKNERVDAAGARKRRRRFRNAGALAARLQPKDAPPCTWPVDLGRSGDEADTAAFPFRGEDRYIGLIHADGNRLGELILTLNERIEQQPELYLPVFRGFSGAVSHATEQAAREAVAEVLVPAAADGVLPGRPIVLGGDDLTMIVRGDLALAFTRCFLERFEQASAEALGGLAQQYGISNLPSHLTGCAGVVLLKASQPFAMGYTLAEELTDHAKQGSRARADRDQPVPSSIAFHRVTTALTDDFEAIVERELSVADGEGTRRRLTLQPYGVGRLDAGLPRLEDLQRLGRLLADPVMSRGPARRLLTTLHLDWHDARKEYARWRQNMAKLDGAGKPGGTPESLGEFDRLLGALAGPLPDPGHSPFNGDGATPLGDAVTLAVTEGNSL